MNPIGVLTTSSAQSSKTALLSTARKALSAAIIATIGLGYGASGSADTGSVTALGQLLATNAVSVTSGGASITVSDNVHPLFNGDSVTTQTDSSAVVRFTGDDGVLYASAGANASYRKKGDQYIVRTNDNMRFVFRTGVDYELITDCFVISPAESATASASDWVGGSIEVVDGEQTLRAASGQLSVARRGGSGDSIQSKLDSRTQDTVTLSDCHLAAAEPASTTSSQPAATVSAPTKTEGSAMSWLLAPGAAVGALALSSSSDSSSSNDTSTVSGAVITEPKVPSQESNGDAKDTDTTVVADGGSSKQPAAQVDNTNPAPPSDPVGSPASPIGDKKNP